MAVTFRNYTSQPGFTSDYFAVRDFYIQRDGMEFPFGRWDSMITHGWLDTKTLPLIGLWEDNGNIVAIATFDTVPGEAYISTLPEYRWLKPDMLQYALENLSVNGKLDVIIRDTDTDFQEAAARAGLEATPPQDSRPGVPHPRPRRYQIPRAQGLPCFRHEGDL